MEESLVDFIRSRKQQQAPAQAIDWQAKKDAWVHSVGKLYTIVEEMLRDPIESNEVTVHKIDTQVTENFIGAYSIPALEITVGTERVKFIPVGITVAGASGRVDIRGERDTVTLLRDAQGEWAVILQRVPRFNTLPLDQSSLKYALERVMRPVP